MKRYKSYRTIIIPKDSEERDCRRVGISNKNNNCFINSILQCLFYTKDLTRHILDGKDLAETVPEYSSTRAFLAIYKSLMWSLENEAKVASMTKFIKFITLNLPDYKLGNQEDSYECLLWILETLNKALSYKAKFVIAGDVKTQQDALVKKCFETLGKFYNARYSIIIEQFYGVYMTTLDCSCGVRSVFEPFSSISVQVNESLDKCIDKHYSDHSQTCSDCQGNCKVSLRNWTLPNTLVVVFKRFDSEGNKIKDTVSFPYELDLTRTIAKEKQDRNNYIYKLNAVNYHVGSSKVGHYYSACLYNDEWCLFDDADVTRVQEPETKNAYILFYERLCIL